MEPGSAGTSPSDQGQREAFLNELGQFLSDKGRYLCRSPNLAGRVIDLHDLYNKVTSAGGYQKVTERGFWEDFLDVYGYPAISTTLAYGLQRIYQLYLEEYERVHYFGDDEPQPFHRSFPGGYSRYRYRISENQRKQAQMNMLKPSVSNYDRVVYSLESCMPNEVDFAVNACTLLSGESRHVLKLPQCKRIIDALLLHAGIVSEGYDSYDGVLEELQQKTKHDYKKFWNNSISKKSVLPVLLPDRNANLTQQNNTDEDSHLMDTIEKNNDGAFDFTNSLHEKLQDLREEKNCNESPNEGMTEKRKAYSELFHGHRSLGVEDYEGQRVLQIALVLLNLSFEDFNVTLLARHPSLVRFVFLCIHSEYSCLRQTGLDILSNISSHMQLLHLNYDIITMVFETVNAAILSNDKFERVRGFESLANICRPHPNVDYVCAHIADEVFEAAVSNLMIQDVELLLAAIEALYRLSKLGESACTRILFVKGCINILMCLVTLNVRTFGPEKLAEIRLARKIVQGQPEISQQPQPQPVQSYHLSSAPTQFPQTPVPRPIFVQQQVKIGSAQQAQPTIAMAAHNSTPPLPQVAKPAPQIKSALPPHQQPARVPVASATMPQRSQVPIPPAMLQPKIEPPSLTTKQVAPQSGQGQQPQQTPQAAQVQPSPKVPSTPPPPSTTPSTVPAPSQNSSPPGVGPTYTHSETGTVPPVFHYMPAPPTDIVQDNSPESFTKLWIWATYESDSESYIPRVDVYCEYLASSNRYGRQGKAEILSATDFGKCLKQIFPLASSRLFNQGRGQPQYHIAGIRKRATPLPVPGYQLKNSSSVFSSELEYEKIPETSQSATTGVVKSKVGSSPPPQTLPMPVSTMSVPIQQLQFQPVLIVSGINGSNNLALVPGAAQVPAGSSIASASQKAPVATQGVSTPAIVPAQTSNKDTTVGAAIPTVKFSNDPSTQSSVASENNESMQQTPPDESQNTLQTPINIPNPKEQIQDEKCSHPVPAQSQNLPNTAPIPTISSAVGLPTPNANTTSVPSTSSTTLPVNASVTALPTSSVKTETTVATSSVAPVPTTQVNDSQTNSNATETKASTAQAPVQSTVNETVPPPSVVQNNGNETSIPPANAENMTKRDGNTQEDQTPTCEADLEVRQKSIVNGSACESPKRVVTNHSAVSNGINEQEEHQLKKQPLIEEAIPMEIDEKLSDKLTSKRRKSRTKSVEAPPRMKEPIALVNGFVDDENMTKTEAKSKINGPNSTDILNGETEAAVNSILEKSDTTVDDIINMNIDKSSNMSTTKLSNSTDCANPSTVTSNAVVATIADADNSECLVKDKSPGMSKETEKSSDSNTVYAPEIGSSQTDSVSQNSQCAVECGKIEVTASDPSKSDNMQSSQSENTTIVASSPATPKSSVAEPVTTPTAHIAAQEPHGNDITTTPTNPIPHSALNQRLKDTITRRKNAQVTPTSSAGALPPSVLQQYSYKQQEGLAQQIITVVPPQLQLHQAQQRPVIASSHPMPNTQGTPQVGVKRSLPYTVAASPAPPVKVLRSSVPSTPYSPAVPYTAPSQQHPNHGLMPRHPAPTVVHRTPHHQPPQQQPMPQRPGTPLSHNSHNPSAPHSKPKPPTIDLMAPNASLLVLYRNVGKIPFADHTDEKEDAISKSVRLTASLILKNLARHSDLGRSMVQQHEHLLACVAMSQMDCSPVVAKLLSELNV